MSQIPLLRLKKNEERRLKGGHLWVFSNEIDTQATPLKGLPPGSIVRIEDARGEPLGVAYANPDCLISARLLTRNPECLPTASFFGRRIRQALTLRERAYEAPYYRLVYGESDGLPGLVVDRFGSLLVIQSSTAGMDALEKPLIEALCEELDPSAILVRNTSSLRALEGLSTRIELVMGELGEPRSFENGASFLIDPLEGQKTGWFFDHRDNRARLAPWCRGQRVLDLFSYTGAWGIQAARHGALEVHAVDASKPALELFERNLALNGLEGVGFTHAVDVFDFLKEARQQRLHWDVVIVDPPAFIKRKKDYFKGLEAYRRLIQMSVQVLAPEGILVAASCSYHLPRESLRDLLRASARHLDRHLQILFDGGQGADHPVHPAIPETDYLKAIFCRVSRSL